jgi:lipopolysaccharide export system permease protein
MNRLDRYILKQILVTLLFALVALCIIFVVVNFMEMMDKFMDAKVPFSIIVEYYLVYLPDILTILTPVAILISCLFTIGRLSNTNEITAMKSGGMGLYRLLLPIATVGILLSAWQFYFNGWIVPNANEKKAYISHEYLKRDKGGGPINNLAFRDAPDRNVLMLYYDPYDKRGYNVTIEQYQPQETSHQMMRLLHQIEAKSIVWNTAKNNWTLRNGIERSISDDNNISVKRFDTMTAKLTFGERQISKINRKTNEMSFSELREYIDLLRMGGKDVRQMEIEYHAAQALPLANFIVILFAVSFASVKKRGGLAVQIAAAMVIVFAYLIFSQLFKPIGLAMNLPAWFVGWFANILFILAGIGTIIKTRT